LTIQYLFLTDIHIRLLITSSDVLHSWAVPSLGIKIDACPGRLNQVHLFIKRPGFYYGQCSEICGIYHSFIPICVSAVSYDRIITVEIYEALEKIRIYNEYVAQQKLIAEKGDSNVPITVVPNNDIISKVEQPSKDDEVMFTLFRDELPAELPEGFPEDIYGGG